MSDNNQEVQFEITKILVKLGMSINLKGFTFYKECIMKVVEDPLAIRNVTKSLYPEVGKIHNVNGSVVERCMRHACDLAYGKTGFKSINKYFGMPELYNWGYKPANSELIALIAEYVRANSKMEAK